ncbi:MAG: hypothetical protein HY707_12755 [Ignavibacteriae bacterium]|nr:hypothetical protein [Ignavibacteriota bacterium]
MRYCFFILACLAIVSCRDIQPFEAELTVKGYQINGTVTTENGVPLDSVQVILYYNYNLMGTTPIDTVQVYLTDLTQVVDVAVYTPRFEFVRQLCLNCLDTVGPVPRFQWNGRDNSGRMCPSGKYLIRYVIDNVIVKDSPLILEGRTTAMTDADGRFTITNDRLPIGEVVDRYDSNDQYLGTFEVTPTVELLFNKFALYVPYSLIVTKDRITTGVFTL